MGLRTQKFFEGFEIDAKCNNRLLVSTINVSRDGDSIYSGSLNALKFIERTSRTP